MKTLISLFVVAVLAFSRTASSSLIYTSQSNFGPTTLHENFSESINFSNAADSPDESKTDSMVITGTSSSYTFSQTGVALTSPIPNNYGDYMPEISAVNAKQNFGFGAYGYFQANSSLIPGGTGARFLLDHRQHTFLPLF